jgi:SAM-dependent methyltransferase
MERVMAPRFVARQLSHPAGILGVVIRQLMNRTNARLNAFALNMLDASPGDRVLEVGFGGGLLLPQLIERASFVCGLDRSAQAVGAANARFAQAVRDGHAEFHEGAIESLPFADHSFNKAITINTVYFWKSLEAGFAELHRVLSPGGRIVIGFLPKEFMDRMNMPKDIFTSRAPEDVSEAMTNARFRDVRMEQRAGAKWRVAVATK